MIAAAAVLSAASAFAPAATGAQAPQTLSSWLDSRNPSPEFQPILAGDSADGYFVTPLRGRPHLRPIQITPDLFHEQFRVGVDSGFIYPLGAQTADYDAGWWARVYGQTGADLGHPLFRTSVEVGVGLGQSQSSHRDQMYRITSNYAFFTLRGLADFLPESPVDLTLFIGIGGGLEFASGHVIMPSGRVEERRQTNFNPLLEAGGGLAFELTPGFSFVLRVAGTYPLGSKNILFFLQAEIGVEFLFL